MNFQDNRIHCRTKGDQVDGASFSFSTTSGESCPEGASDNKAGTDMYQADGDIASTLSADMSKPTLRRKLDSQICSDDGAEARSDRYKGKKHSEEQGVPEEADYIDFLQLLSVPSTPAVQQESVPSISHLGTLSKRHRPDSKDTHSDDYKRVKTGEESYITTTSHRPCEKLTQNPETPSMDPDTQSTRQANPSDTHVLHTSLARQQAVVRDIKSDIKRLPLDAPTAPRSMRNLPLICYYFYHFGNCIPKPGKSCDHLHDKSTLQQTVSLPANIRNHDPACSLPLCPVRLMAVEGAKVRPKSFVSRNERKVSSRLMLLPPGEGFPSSGRPDHRPHIASTDSTRELYMKRSQPMRNKQARESDHPKGISTSVASAQYAWTDRQLVKKRRRESRKLKRSLRMETQRQVQQELNRLSDASSTRESLTPLFIKRETCDDSIPLYPDKESSKQRKFPGMPHSQGGISPNYASREGYHNAASDAYVDPARAPWESTNMGPTRTFSDLDAQCRPGYGISTYACSQASLGMTAVERKARPDTQSARMRLYRLSDGGPTLQADRRADIDDIDHIWYRQEFQSGHHDDDDDDALRGRRSFAYGGQSCIDDVEHSIPGERHTSVSNNVTAVDGQLPEDEQSLDWESDTVARLCGEIE